MRALVSGASGMVGSAIVDALRARGDQVRALVRPTSRVDTLLAKGVDLVVGDLGKQEGLREAVQGIDVVFHAAALLGNRATPEALHAVNVVGTERILAASRDARVSRFVHISSVGVYGPQAPPVTETAPQHPNSPYGESKKAAEEAVWRAHSEGLPVTVLRPCVVYGPGDRVFTPILAQLMRFPLLPLPAAGDLLVELVYSTDVAAAAVLAATRPAAVGQAYNITDGRPTTLRDVVETYALLIGQGPRIIGVSQANLTRAASILREALAPVAPGLAHALTASVLADLAHDIHFDISKAERQLGYRPQVGLYEGLRHALSAYDPDLLNRHELPNVPVLAGGALVVGGLVGAILLRRMLTGKRAVDASAGRPKPVDRHR